MVIDPNLVVFLLFLIINLAVGLRYGRKVKTIKDYALGGRNFSTGALVATMVATCVSGSGFIITLSNVYSDGLLYLLATLGLPLSIFVIGVFLVPRMGHLMGTSSVGEVMGDAYGPHVRLIVAISGVIVSIGGIAVQYSVFGSIVNYFWGMPTNVTIIISALVLTIYSAFGGIRAITFTDVLQFITFGIALPLIGLIIWSQVSSDSNFSLQQAFANPLFDYHKIISLSNQDFLLTLPLILYFTVPQMGQDVFQRISIGRDIGQVRRAFVISAAILFVINLVVAWVPFLIANINPNLNPAHILSFIVDNYTYPGLKGLIIIGIVAMAMSTADSDLNAATVLFGNDICNFFKLKRPNYALFLSKIFAFVLSAAAVVLALTKQNLLSIVLTANSIYMTVITIPFIMLILGFHTTPLVLNIAMTAGVSMVVIWKIFAIPTDSIIFGMLANCICLFAAHYLLKQPGGWVGVKDRRYLDEKARKRQRKWKKIQIAIQEWSFKEFCKNHAPKDELSYTSFGIYCIIYTVTTMYSTQVEFIKTNSTLGLFVYQVMMITGTLMALLPIWPTMLKRETIIQAWWCFAVFYMLIFFNCFFVLVGDFGRLQFVLFTVNNIIAISLIGWRVAFAMSIAGFPLAVEFYKFYTGIESVNLGFDSSQFILLYILVLLGTIVTIFFKPQQDAAELAQEKIGHLTKEMADRRQEIQKNLELKHELLRNLEHETHTPITCITSMSEILNENYDRLSEQERRDTIEEIAKSSTRLSSLVNNMVNLSKLTSNTLALASETINISDLLYDRLELCQKLYIQHSEEGLRQFEIKSEPDIIFKGDKYYIEQLLDNLIINAIQYCPEGMIVIILSKNQAHIELSICDEGIGIPKSELYDIFSAFVVSSRTKTPAGGRGLGLTLCKKIVELHGGTIWVETNPTKGVTFKLILPCKRE